MRIHVLAAGLITALMMTSVANAGIFGRGRCRPCKPACYAPQQQNCCAMESFSTGPTLAVQQLQDEVLDLQRRVLGLEQRLEQQQPVGQ